MTSTPDIIAEASALLARAQDHVASVVAYAQAQAQARDALADERDVAKAQAADLQQQLDAARARIAELEGQSKPQPDPVPEPPPAVRLATPELLAMDRQQDGTIWLNWTPVEGARNYVVWLQTRDPQQDIRVVVPATEANRPDGTVGWHVTLPGGRDYSRWEFWGRVQAQGETGGAADSDWTPQTNNRRVQMPANVPTVPAEPTESPDGFATARIITDAAEAQRVLRTAGSEPLIIRIPGTVRIPLRVESNRHNVWFDGLVFADIPGSASGKNALSIAPGARNVQALHCRFVRCGIAIWLHGTRCQIAHCRFEDCDQAIHSMWYTLAEDCHITDNVMHNCRTHDVELQTSGNIDERKVLARNIIFARNRSTGTPRGKIKMIYSIAIGHGENIKVYDNYSSGGDWAFEIMTGCQVYDNVMEDCNVGLMVYSKARNVVIGAGNACRNVGREMDTYHGPWVDAEHKRPQWVTQGEWRVSA